jgi:hypothetical protein
MALSKDEQATLDALNAKATEPEEDFSIEIWDESGAGAKVPYSKGRSWLARFGIDVEALPSPEAEEGTSGTKAKPAANSKDTVVTRHFGPKKSA